MGLFDMIKGAVNAVTGGGAKVTIEYKPQTATPGQPISVKVTATSTGGEVKSKGCFVDVLGSEQVNIPDVTASKVIAQLGAPPHTGPNPRVAVSISKATYEAQVPISGEFVLGANETKVFEGVVILPVTAQPTFAGAFTQHKWMLRGRVEAWGNDPDSGYQPLAVSGLGTTPPAA